MGRNDAAAYDAELYDTEQHHTVPGFGSVGRCPAAIEGILARGRNFAAGLTCSTNF